MSNDFFFPTEESALDLTIKGSVGRFAVRTPNNGRGSVEVQYIETHVGFAVSGDAEERLLQQLVPVREVFNVAELEFDELMQRDIDDARVSTELIPYLLEDSGEALVKLFPPIVVVVLPTGPNGRPANAYPAVETLTEPDPKQPAVRWQFIRSGSVGAEAFEFKQMLSPQDKPSAHDYAQLKLNTTRCKLAIVDGQHRAMALLALYRNHKGWPEGTYKYRDYYKRWAPSVIREYDLSKVQLPVLLCTFPSLHEGNQDRQLKTTAACRSVFLALNKNAKPVSRARNHLLNDDDVIAHFLRCVLSHIKQQDSGSKLSLRLWNFELDSEGDKRILSTHMAISGVMHLYGMFEFLMLNHHTVGKLRHPKQNFWKKKGLDDCIRRLDAKSLLGTERADKANRRLIERETARILSEQFWKTYGKYVIQALDEFWPYRAHNQAALALEARLKTEANGSTYHAVLFEGQGIGRVFDSYIERLKDQRAELGESGATPPELEASYQEFESRSKELDKLVATFYSQRAQTFLKGVSPKNVSEVQDVVQDLYRNTFTTEAFQYALLITFFAALEQRKDQGELNGESISEESLNAWFSEYLFQLNGFFCPESNKAAWNIVRTFYGDVSGGYGGQPAQAARSTTCLKKILVPGELKPDEWAKFRYVLLELWNPSDGGLASYVQQHRRQLRLTACRAFETHELDQEARRHGKLVTAIPAEEQGKIVRQAMHIYCNALSHLGVQVTPQSLGTEEELREAAEEENEEEVNLDMELNDEESAD